MDGGPEPLAVAAPIRTHSLAEQVGGGIVGGLAGVVVGAIHGAGSVFEGMDESESLDGWKALFALLGAAAGATMGEPAGLACGVHLANGRQGDMVLDTIVSGLIAGAGIGMALKTNESRILIAIPVLQLVGVVAAERASAAKSNRGGVKWCQ